MKMKKFLAVIMSLCMTAGAVSYGAPVIAQTITAQADSVESNCYSFDEATGVLTLKGELDGNAVRYFNRLDEVKAIIAEKGTVFPEDCSKLFSEYKNCTTIDISEADTSKVKDMYNMFRLCTSLNTISSFEVDENNPKYCSVDGVLYKKAKTLLIQCPKSKTELSFPKTLTDIGAGAFYQNTDRKIVAIPNGVKTIGDDAFGSCTALSTVSIPKSVTKISSSIV